MATYRLLDTKVPELYWKNIEGVSEFGAVGKQECIIMWDQRTYQLYDPEGEVKKKKISCFTQSIRNALMRQTLTLLRILVMSVLFNQGRWQETLPWNCTSYCQWGNGDDNTVKFQRSDIILNHQRNDRNNYYSRQQKLGWQKGLIDLCIPKSKMTWAAHKGIAFLTWTNWSRADEQLLHWRTMISLRPTRHEVVFSSKTHQLKGKLEPIK